MNTRIRNLAIAVSLIIGSLILFPSFSTAQCQNWGDALLKSFFQNQLNEEFLNEATHLSPQSYFESREKNEDQVLAGANRVNIPEMETQLHPALERFDNAGFGLYGVRLNPNRFAILSDMDINASATGSIVRLNKGTADYFLNPAGYLAEMGIIHAFNNGGRLEIASPQEYSLVTNYFGWQQDWDSLYFILAHETAHNLMRHPDQRLFSELQKNLKTYQQAALDERRDLAEGRNGGGVKRFLAHGFEGFMGQYQSSAASREIESEADVVGLLLLQRAGFNPNAGTIASQKMDLLVGSQQNGGWQSALSSALCSTHPDWEFRIQEIQRNLSCLRFSGDICEKHVSFDVEQSLSALRKDVADVDKYRHETETIAGSAPENSISHYEVEIKTKPRDAELFVDGKQAPTGTLQLTVGRHVLTASKEGFEQAETDIAVFSDIEHPKITIKLKKEKN